MIRGKTICFIDNSNVFGGSLQANWRIDYKKLMEKIERDGDIWQVYFFASEQDPPTDNQTSFYHYVKTHLRWECMIYKLGKKSITCPKCRNQWVANAEKAVDIGLAAKMLILAFNRAFDTAVLVGGDRDYLDTVKFVKSQGLRVEMYSWRNSMSSELSEESSVEPVYFEDIREEISRE